MKDKYNGNPKCNRKQCGSNIHGKYCEHSHEKAGMCFKRIINETDNKNVESNNNRCF